MNRSDPSGLDWVTFDGDDVYYWHEVDSWWPGRQSSGATKIGTRGPGGLVKLDPGFQYYGRQFADPDLINANGKGVYSGDYSGAARLARIQTTMQMSVAGHSARAMPGTSSEDIYRIYGDGLSDTGNKLSMGLTDRVGVTNTAAIYADAERVAAMNAGGANYLRTGGTIGLQLAAGGAAFQTLKAAGGGVLAMEAAGVSSQAVTAARVYTAVASTLAAANGVDNASAAVRAASNGQTGTAMKEAGFAGLNFLGAFAGGLGLNASVARSGNTAVHFTSAAGKQGIEASGWLNGPSSAWTFATGSAPSNPITAFFSALLRPSRLVSKVEGINASGLQPPTIRGPWSLFQSMNGVLRTPGPGTYNINTGQFVPGQLYSAASGGLRPMTGTELFMGSGNHDKLLEGVGWGLLSIPPVAVAAGSFLESLGQ